MKRVVFFLYGTICYAIFLFTFLYAVGFIGDLFVPKTLDSGAAGPLGTGILINATLLAIFAIQHSVMARPAFKRLWTRVIPKPVERSTYVLFSSLALIAVFTQWKPLGGVIWDVQDPVGSALIYGLYAFGWVLVLTASFLINHFDLFGMRQVWLYLQGKKYTKLKFQTPGFYKLVRHPLYVGWLFAFWATPTMTIAHLLFAIATTAYILIAIQLEERDLMDIHGSDYRHYRQAVPMLIPFSKKTKTPKGAMAE